MIDANGDYAPDQPEPIACTVARLRGVTAIHRRWDAWQVETCRLCPTCQATEDGDCLVLTTETVSHDQAGLYSICHLKVGRALA